MVVFLIEIMACSPSSASSSPARKIVIAMDGSKHSEYALKYCKDTLLQDNDDVTVVYAVEHGTLISQPLFTTDPQFVAHLAVEEDKEVQTLIDKLTATMEQAGVKGRVQRMSANSPGEAIIKAAKDLQADLIVTGTRGHGKLRRTILGSVSQYVVHHSHVPVLVCHDK